MDVQATSPQQSYTILRIKRKRNEEPLDALVVESRRKKSKSKGGVNVFQFAETVEQSAWEDEKLKQDLESRISSLARETTKKGTQPESPVPPVPAKRVHQSPVSLPQRSPAEERKYKIVQSDSTESPIPAKHRRITAPPKVHSYKDLQKASFTLYDAVPSEPPAASPMTVDQEIDKFLPMVQDYLRLNSIDAVPPSKSEEAVRANDNDYVWDVFYSRPVNYHELNRMASNIGTVTGLPDADLYASDSDSEEDDEDDEDSNAEDWYANDYPDEESDSNSEGGGDEFHENSDNDDVIYEERFDRVNGYGSS